MFKSALTLALAALAATQATDDKLKVSEPQTPAGSTAIDPPRSPPAATAGSLFGDTSRPPDPARVQRDLALLEGAWEVVQYIEDGEEIAPDIVRDRLIKDGRFTITRWTIRKLNPRTGEEKTWGYRIDPSTTPSSIVLTNDDNEQVRGIYKFEGDRLVVCLGETPLGSVRREFSSTPGSGEMLLTLRAIATSTLTKEQQAERDLARAKQMADDARRRDDDARLREAELKFRETQITPTQSTTTVAAAAPVAAPSAADLQRARDADYRTKLVGTWRHQDGQGYSLTIFRKDGTFISTRYYQKPLKRMFRDESTRNGTWSVRDGMMVMRILGSENRGELGREMIGKVQSIDDRSAIYTDLLGRIDRATRVQ